MAKLLWPCTALVLLMVVGIQCIRRSSDCRRPAARKTSLAPEEIVYRVQRNSDADELGDQWAATDIGEVVFLASYHRRYKGQRQLRDQVLVQHRVQFQFMEKPEHAFEEYNRSFPSTNSTTVGVWGGRQGGWMSFPFRLQCGEDDDCCDGDCSWKHLQFIKRISASCLLELQLNSTQKAFLGLPDDETVTFEHIFTNFKVPRGFVPHFLTGGWTEERVQQKFDAKSKVALRLFKRAFDECPDVQRPTLVSRLSAMMPIGYEDFWAFMMPAAFGPFGDDQVGNLSTDTAKR